MKIKGKNVLMYLLLYAIAVPSLAQFEVMRSGTAKDLHSVYFADSHTGYAVGREGTVLKTHNEGRTWYMLALGTINDVNDVWFISPDTGFVVGDHNLFLQTVNGGQSWQEIALDGEVNLKTIQFTGKSMGYVAGHGNEGGVFLKTTDSGQTWAIQTITDDCTNKAFTTQQACDDIYLMNMSFLNDQVGVLGGFAYNFTYGKRPYICKTDDGGQTFTEISPQFTRSEWYLGKEIVSLNYLNDHDVIAIMNTGTGTDFLFMSDYRVNSFGWINDENTFKARGWYYGMEFLGQYTGYFTGVVDGQSQVIKTIDQGNSLMFLKPPTNHSLYASFFIDEKTGYFVGQGGVILRLKDKNNIVYRQKDGKYGAATDELPYSYAFTRKGMKKTDIHIYNIAATEKRLYQIKVQDRFGNQIPVKRLRTRIYTDEIRVFVTTDALASETYFYAVLYDDQPVLNGKLDLSQIAHH
ncbi:MAG: YCF48-related protein [Bacteroidales bacterium]